MKNINKIKFLTAFFCFLAIVSEGYSQIYFGFKAGANASQAYLNNVDYNAFYDAKLKPGFMAGTVFLMENKGKFGLYNEILYSVRGKSIESHANDYESNKTTYHFIEIPLMFRAKFKEQWFDWFLQVGPEASYWLGGNGVFHVYQRDRGDYSDYQYLINFGEPKSTVDYMNVTDPNRLQLGLTIGGGFIWELNNANFISLDIRLSFGHTYMGQYEGGSIPNLGLSDNFEHSNNTLGISAVYYFDILEKIKLSKHKY